MNRKYETDLKFSQNWGGKLDHARYTTFRGQDKLFKIGSDLPVSLASGLFHDKKSYGYVKVLGIEFKRIKDVTITEILADIGRRTSTQPRVYFFKLLKDFYGHKRWWDGENTVIQKVTVERIGGKFYAGS